MKIRKSIITPIVISILFTFCFIQNGQTILGQTNPKSNIIDLNKSAEKNKILQYSLRWKFGKKTQKGWYLYVPLIQETLKTDFAPDTPEFAGKVFFWQSEKKIKISGIIDTRTLYSFINQWQSQRLKPIILARETQLLTADISNFYDPTRNIELLKVEKETFKAYKEMLAAAIADESNKLKVDEKGHLAEDELFLKLVSTYRSPAYQASLRKRQPNASRAQIAYKSPHFTGHALDIYVGGAPVTTADFNRAIQIKTPVYKWLVKNAGEFGFYPYFYEPWHWEYVGK